MSRVLSLPKEAGVLERFRAAFTAPRYQRLLVLCVGAIVAMGRRSVSRILWSVRCLMQGHPQQLSPLPQPRPLVVVAAARLTDCEFL